MAGIELAAFIREIGRGAEGARDMSRAEAQQLYGAILDGDVPDLEQGAIAIALRMKTETVDEMTGFLAAANERLPRQLLARIYNRTGQPGKALEVLRPIIDSTNADSASLTLALQLGFVVGALASAAANLADLLPPTRLLLIGSIGTATANALLLPASSAA